LTTWTACCQNCYRQVRSCPYISPSLTQEDQSTVVRRGGNRQAPASTTRTTAALHRLRHWSCQV